MTDQLLADARFDALLAAPDIAEMLKLSPSEFEQFVAAVFQSAGYFVEDVTRRFGQGLDLKLYTGGRAATHPAMCVSIKRYADKVGLQEVFQLRGALKGPNNTNSRREWYQ
jgi:restriction endonuclease Mrr